MAEFEMFQFPNLSNTWSVIPLPSVCGFSNFDHHEDGFLFELGTSPP
jgi:hypothetical protein